MYGYIMTNETTKTPRQACLLCRQEVPFLVVVLYTLPHAVFPGFSSQLIIINLVFLALKCLIFERWLDLDGEANNVLNSYKKFRLCNG